MGMKKVVVIIVEGISDEIALEGVLRKVYNTDEVRYRIVGSDITSTFDNRRNNIKSKVTEQIKAAINRLSIDKEDILKVIHIVDMDGAYIDENHIRENKLIDGFRYYQNRIEARNIDEVIDRNKRKTENLNVLSELKKVFVSLDYSVYYLSCNQEHVLHNLIHVADRDKAEYAERFNEKYEDNLEGFKEFIQNKEFAVQGDYKDTWDFIKKDTNSLKRYSNFHLILKNEGLI